MPVLTVVAGANGAGKSTLTRLGHEVFQDSPLLDPDAISVSLRATVANAGSAIDAGREVLDRSKKLLDAKQSFLVETTLSGNTYLRMMLEAKAAGYIVRLIYVGTNDVAINIQRIRQRVKDGGHDVPEEDQIRRYPRSMANFKDAFNLADEAIVFDNSTDQGHIRIADKSKDCVKVYGTLPDWAAFLKSA